MRVRLFFMHDSMIYIAPISGLLKADLNLERIDTVPELIDNKVLDIKANTKNLFVATAESGLLTLRNEVFRPFYDSGRFSCPLVRMLDVSDERIYMATECGLLSDNLKDGKNSLKILNGNNGLLNTSVNFIGFVASQLLCFAAEGISVIDTADLNYASHVKFYLKNTLVNEHKVSVLDELKSNENNIEFNFGFIAYGNRDIKVKHRPSPKFSWVDGGVDKIRYYSLSPGLYEPEISYSVAGGKWQITKLSKPFAILPVWWETIYFRILVVVSVIVIVGLTFYIFYQKRIARLSYQENLRQEKDRISRELHDNIGSKLAYIKISLSGLNNSHEFQDKRSHIEVHLNSAVSELRDTIWAINKDEVSLVDFVDRVRMMLSRLSLHGLAIEFTFTNSNPNSNLDTMDPAVAVDLFRIIQEAVNNSIKHSGANKIMVELGLQLTQKLSINVKDNGVGFSEALILQSDGYGLYSMKKRAEKLGANFKLSSSPGAGTEINVTYQLTA